MKKIAYAALLLSALALLSACSLQPETDAQTPAQTPAPGVTQLIVPSVPYSLNLDDNGFYQNLRALDYVTLPADLLSIPYDAEKCTVTDAEVQAEIDALLDAYTIDVQVTDRAVKDGDQVNIDYIGRVDGKEFPGGNSQGQGSKVTAGSAQFIDDFLTQIIGHKPGETFDVTVTFPTPYSSSPDLAGKEAVFETTIHYIYSEQTPLLTDAFVAENYPAYDSAQAMRAAVLADMSAARLRGYALEYAVTNSAFKEFPAFLTEGQGQILLAEMAQTAAAYNLDLSAVLAAYGAASEEELLAQYEHELLDAVKQFVTLQAVAEQQGISVTKEDAEAYIAELVEGTTFEQYAGQLGEGYIFRAALDDAVLDLLTANLKQG